MTFEPNPVTTEQLVEYLTKKVGSDIGCNDIREAGETLSISYATACKRLKNYKTGIGKWNLCLLYTSPSPRDRTRSRMPSSA